MWKFYETVEQAYGNPTNYPEPIAAKKLEGHHHQTEEVAWGYLGNAKRMETLGQLLEQAKAAAETAEQKQRIALFELGVWDYMTAGRKQYLEHVKTRFGQVGGMLRVPFLPKGSVHDPGEWLALTGWRSRFAEPTRRTLMARLCHDGENLYLRLEESRLAVPLEFRRDPRNGDHWQVLFAVRPAGPVHDLRVNGSDLLLLDRNTLKAKTSTTGPATIGVSSNLWQQDGKVLTPTTPISATIVVAIPLERISVAPGGRFYLNVVRRSPSSADEPMWSPSFGAFEVPAALRELTLDTADTIPTNVPTGDHFRRLDQQGLVRRWELDESLGVPVYSNDGEPTGKLVNGATRERLGMRRVVRLQDNRQQYVHLGNAKDLDLTGLLSLLVWVKYEPTETWYPGLLGKGYELSGTYGLHLRPGGTAWFELDAPDGTRHIYNPTDRCVSPEQWCHVAATYDGTTMRVYLNGREAGTGKPVTTAIRTNTEPLRFGWLGSYGHFNGCVRDASVYNRALRREEVFAHYLRGRGG
jgi:hypothetical protein